MKTTDDPAGDRVLIPARDITGVVLCGGEGRRMGGVEKPLLPLHGRPLIRHVLDRLEPQVGGVILSANRAHETYRTFGHAVVSDLTAGQGPLGGLAAVAPQVETPWILCCPGDAPRIDRTLASRLACAVGAPDVAAYPHDGERGQFLFLLLRTATCTSLTGYLAGSNRSVHGWLAGIGAREVPMPDIAGTFTNVNDPAGLAWLAAEP